MPAFSWAESRVAAARIGGGLIDEVAMTAWPRPAAAASVPCSISVQVAIASILAMATSPEVRANRLGTA